MENIYQIVFEHLQELKPPAILSTPKSNHNYPWYWAFIDLKGKEIYGYKFRLYPEDALIILQLFIWFLRDTNAAEQFKIRLDAGLLVTGPVGCGKTTLVKLCSYLATVSNKPCFKSCREISLEVAADGPATILHFTRHSFDYVNSQPRTWMFDDLGVESMVNFYGTPISPMTDILLGRYDYFLSHSMQTIITSNLNSQEIEMRYGIRVRSRLREMMNLLAFPADSRDKR
jgi:hypothetical protein